MNLELLIIWVAIIVMVVDVLIKQNTQASSLLYTCTFGLFFFIFAIKYYSGTDICSYVPLYENIESIWDVIQGNNDYFVNHPFEFGYKLFNSLLKGFGLSFWWFTLVVLIINFYTLNLCLKQLDRYKTVALCVVVIFLLNLYLDQFRQSLAVSFFIISIFSFLKRRWIKYIMFSILTILMHKSGIIIVGLSLIFLLMCSNLLQSNTILIIALLYFVIPLISIPDIIIYFSNSLDFLETTKQSIQHHLIINVYYFQKIVIVYFFTTLFISLIISQNHINITKKEGNLLFLMLLLFLILYPYFNFLERVRSYFLPILIVPIITILAKHKTFSTILLCMFLCIMILRGLQSYEHYYNRTTTVFSLLFKDSDEIKYENIQAGYKFWNEEYFKNNEQ